MLIFLTTDPLGPVPGATFRKKSFAFTTTFIQGGRAQRAVGVPWRPMAQTTSTFREESGAGVFTAPRAGFPELGAKRSFFDVFATF
jgi:hypothetical protein